MPSTAQHPTSDQFSLPSEEFSSLFFSDMDMRKNYQPHLMLETAVQYGDIPLWIYPVPYGTSADKFFHTHDFSEIVIITEGEVDHIINNESVHLCKGDVLCLHPGVTHGYNGCSHVAMINVIYDIPRLALPCFDAFDLNRFNVFFPPPKDKESYSPLFPILHLSDSDFQKILGIVNSYAKEINSSMFGKGLMALFYFIHLVITLSRLMQPDDNMAASNSPERIGLAVDYVNRHFTEEISTEKLAQLACTSKRSLFRLFKQKTGMKIKAYVQKLRLQKAYTMLLCTSEPVKKIAWQCGFSSDHRFCKIFHDTNNCTPLEFRSHARKNRGTTSD